MIILIRHAEKKKDSIHLSHKGVLRANYLADYFKFPYGEFNVPSRKKETLFVYQQFDIDPNTNEPIYKRSRNVPIAMVKREKMKSWFESILLLLWNANGI